MELKDKKIAFLGDSITEGVGVNDTNHIFWKRIESSCGADCYGYGIGGTRIAIQQNASEEEPCNQYFASRV